MAFKDCIGGDFKQRINLSYSALNVINSDMSAFHNNQFTNFINTVITNHIYKSDASISIALERERKKLEQQLKTLNCSETDKIIARLLGIKKTELTKKAASYENFKSCPVRLHKGTVEYLTDPYSECKENIYYNNKPGKYLKALVEDYASKPYSERELIYFADRVTLIKTAIKERRKLSVKFSDERHYIIYPVKLVKDPMAIYNYVVGYSFNKEDKAKSPVSLRISGDFDIRLMNGEFSLSKEDIKNLNNCINNKGIQFLIGEESDIVVILTERGKQKFSSQIHLRPSPVEVRNGNEYVFRCTPAQAEFYFVKFGKDAYIKEPEDLHRKMLNIYHEAYKVYKQD